MADNFDEQMREYLGLPQARNKSPASSSEAVKLPPLEVPSTMEAPKDDVEFNAQMREFLGLPEQQEPQGFQAPDFDSVPDGPRKSYARVFVDAISRNAGQIRASIPTLRGLYAEATGDEEAAAAFAADAQRLQAEAPEQYQEFSKIRSLEDFAYWATESFGENVLTLPLIMGGGGIGALVGKGLLSPLAGRYLSGKLITQGAAGVGAFVPSTGLETADTAQGLRQATGSYQPGVSLTAGAMKGALEMVTPMMLNRFLKEGARDILKATGKGSLSELVTEGLQNETDVWARRYADPSFNPWSSETWLQRAESMVAGSLVGGGFSAAASTGGNVIQRGKQVLEDKGYYKPKEFSAEELAELEGESPINWLRKKFLKRDGSEPDIESSLSPDTQGLLGPMTAFAKGSMTPEQMSRQGEWIERNTPRYMIGDIKGERVKTLLNATDVNTEYVKSPLHFGKQGPKVYQIAQGALIPQNLTASAKDAGFANEDEIYFLQGVTADEQQVLLDRFRVIQPALQGTGDVAALTEYQNLLNEGLRVIPQPGASIEYVGKVWGKETKLPEDQRTEGVLESTYRINRGNPQNPNVVDPKAIDLLRLREGDAGLDWTSTGRLPLKNELTFAPGVDEELLWQQIQSGALNPLSALRAGAYVKPNPKIHKGMEHALVLRDPQLAKRYSVPGANISSDISMNIAVGITRNLFPAQRQDHAAYTKPKDADAERVKKYVDEELPWLNDLLQKLKVPQLQYWVEPGIPSFVATAYYASADHSVTMNASFLARADSEYIKSVLYHEVGHAVTVAWWESLPSAIQQTIYGEYKRQALRSALMKDNTNIGAERSVDRNNRYYNTFVEYLAEQFRRYAHVTRWKEGSEIDKAILRGKKQLEDYWKAVGKNFNIAEAEQLFAPGRDFYKWMDYLDSGLWPTEAEANKTWTQMALSGVMPELEGNYSVAQMKEIVDSVIAEHGKRLFPEGVTISREELSPGEVASFAPDQMKVRLSAAAARYGAEGVLSHELIHVLRNLELIHPTEWSLLVEEAKRRAGNVEKVESEYRHFFTQQANELIRLGKLHPYGKRAWLERQLDEELVAELMRDYVNGQVNQSSVTKVFEKIMAFLQELYAKLVGAQLESPQKIMSSIWNGEMSSRARMVSQAEFLKRKEAIREAKIEAWQKENGQYWTEKDVFGQTPPPSLYGPRTGTQEELEDFRRTTQLGREKTDRNDPRPPAKVIQFPKNMADKGLKEFDAFLQGPQKNAWIEVENGLKIYLRKKNGEPNTITLASMESDQPGSGQLTSFLDKIEGTPGQKLEVENIMNSRLAEYLRKRGWKVFTEFGMTQARFPKKMMDRLHQIYPDTITKVSEDLWVAQETSEGVEGPLTQFRFYKPPKVDMANLDIPDQLHALGEEVGFVELEGNFKGHEVQYVNVKPKFRKQGFSREFYSYIERRLKTKLNPSGILTPEGYAMWQRRDPSWIRYHVKDSVDGFWYSPNYIVKMLNFNNMLLSRARTQEEKLDYKQQRARWERLKSEVDAKAWNDPELDKMFMKTPKGVEENLLRMGAKEVESRSPQEFSSPPPMGFEESLQEKMAQSQQRNAAILGIPIENAAPAQPETHGVKRVLAQTVGGSGARISAQADRIGWFSKRWWSITQLWQQNRHIHELGHYVNTVEFMQNERSQWLSKADTTARAWDKLSKGQPEALADLLFWLTEMKYRSPQEVQNRIVRQPTPAELQAYMTQNKITLETQAVFQQVKQDFEAFLAEYESIITAAIQRAYANNPQGLQNAMAELQKEMAGMRNKPYFPMTRFGQWTVTVKDDQTNQVVGFWAFPTKREQEKGAREIARTHPGTRIRLDRMPENVMEFQGLPPGMLRRIRAEFPGLTPTQQKWLEEFEASYAPQNSFKKRWLERKGTEGYSLDALRAYSHYFMMGSNYLVRLKYKDQLAEIVNSFEQSSKAQFEHPAGQVANAIPRETMNKRRLILDYVRSHMNYVLEGGQDFAKTKALITLWYLGFSPVAAATNLSQQPLMTWPILSDRFGVAAMTKSFARVNQAFKSMGGVTWANAPWAGYEIGRTELKEQGRLDAGQAMELGAYAEGNNLVAAAAGTSTQRALRKLSHFGMWMFQRVEQLNREMTYAMAFQLAMENQESAYVREIGRERLPEINRLIFKYSQLSIEEATAIIAAKDIIDRTQFNYNPYNRPAFMRHPKYGAATNVILMFYQFTQNVAYTVRNDSAWWRIFLMAGITAGMMGLPGAEELDEIVGMFFRLRGIKEKPSEWMRKQVMELTEGTLFDSVGPDIVMRGLSRYGGGLGLLPDGLWAPEFDMSRNLSMGQLSPGGIVGEGARLLGSGEAPNKIGGQLAAKGSGAGLSYMYALTNFLLSNPFSAQYRDWERVMPRSMKAISKGIRYGFEGKETLRNGAKIAEFDIRDPQDLSTILFQMMGAQPTAVSKQYEYRAASRDIERYYQQRKTAIYGQAYDAVESKSPEAVQDVVKAIQTFNDAAVKEGAPTMAINARRLFASIKNRTRAQMMNEMGYGAQKQGIPIYQDMARRWGVEVGREKIK